MLREENGLIEVKNLSKNYGPVPAVKGISFTVKKGAIYGFLGPNGAGKSTTLNMICGCLATTCGEVSVCGHDIIDEPLEAKACIGYLPEIPPLYTDMTPFEYLEFVGLAKGLRKNELYDEIEYVMEKTKISDVADRLIKNLSKGYRQRVGIAQALVGNPDILIFDEPTVGLDPKQIIEIRNLIRSLGKNHTVILSTHILQEVSAVCDRVAIISQGRIVAQNTIQGLEDESYDKDELMLTVLSEDKGVKDAILSCNLIESLTGVASGKNGVQKFIIKQKSGADIRPELCKVLSQKGITIGELRCSAPTLEEIFIKYASMTEFDDEETMEKEEE